MAVLLRLWLISKPSEVVVSCQFVTRNVGALLVPRPERGWCSVLIDGSLMSNYLTTRFGPGWVDENVLWDFWGAADI